MRNILIVIFVFVAAVAFAEDYTVGKDVMVDFDNCTCFDMDGKPFSKNGVVKNYIGGELSEELMCKNGKFDGILKGYYYDIGKLYREIPYKNGKIEGVAKQYFTSGNVEEEVPFKNNKIEGTAKIYYESGQLERQLIYKNDKREGTKKIYRENGKYIFTFIYKNDTAVSGECHRINGKVVPLTASEINGWNNDVMLNCD